MVQLQQLCDKVPPFDSAVAFQTIRDELGIREVSEVYSKITPEPVAAASLGQVYKATLRENGEEVAVKVQRPFVLETVSLDLHLTRLAGLALRTLNPESAKRVDIVALLDEFAAVRGAAPRTHTVTGPAALPPPHACHSAHTRSQASDRTHAITGKRSHA